MNSCNRALNRSLAVLSALTLTTTIVVSPTLTWAAPSSHQAPLAKDELSPAPDNLGKPEQTGPGGGSRMYQFIPPPPPGTGSPSGRSRGGGSRGDGGGCQVGATPPLTALVPTEFRPATVGGYESVLTLTTASHPVFWFYLPYALDGSIPVEYVLLNEQDDLVYQTRFNPTLATAGLLRVATPESVPALVPEQRYHWYFLIYCDPQTPTYVEGWVEGTQLGADQQAALAEANPRQRGAIYAAAGIWQDALDQLAILRQRNPDDPDLQTDWQTLLNSADLGDLTTAPLLDCCTLP